VPLENQAQGLLFTSHGTKVTLYSLYNHPATTSQSETSEEYPIGPSTNTINTHRNQVCQYCSRYETL